jgi:predicted GNAT family N-acyltransferase
LKKGKAKLFFFFSLRNDRISAADTTKWNKLSRSIPNDKRTRKGSYPAVIIGRLGIDKNFQGQGLGIVLMDIIKNFVRYNQYPTGAKFLTVDAYKDSVNYYLKNGFDFLTDKDIEDDTRAMYYDLVKLEN